MIKVWTFLRIYKVYSYLRELLSRYHPSSITLSITWVLVRNENFSALTQIHWIGDFWSRPRILFYKPCRWFWWKLHFENQYLQLPVGNCTVEGGHAYSRTPPKVSNHILVWFLYMLPTFPSNFQVRSFLLIHNPKAIIHLSLILLQHQLFIFQFMVAQLPIQRIYFTEVIPLSSSLVSNHGHQLHNCLFIVYLLPEFNLH